MQQNQFTTKLFYNKKLTLLEVTHKSYAQNWKICKLYIYWEYLLCLESNASGSFLQTRINFVEQRLKFSHFASSITP